MEALSLVTWLSEAINVAFGVHHCGFRFDDLLFVRRIKSNKPYFSIAREMMILAPPSCPIRYSLRCQILSDSKDRDYRTDAQKRRQSIFPMLGNLFPSYLLITLIGEIKSIIALIVNLINCRGYFRFIVSLNKYYYLK